MVFLLLFPLFCRTTTFWIMDYLMNKDAAHDLVMRLDGCDWMRGGRSGWLRRVSYEK